MDTAIKIGRLVEDAILYNAGSIFLDDDAHYLPVGFGFQEPVRTQIQTLDDLADSPEDVRIKKLSIFISYFEGYNRPMMDLVSAFVSIMSIDYGPGIVDFGYQDEDEGERRAGIQWQVKDRFRLRLFTPTSYHVMLIIESQPDHLAGLVGDGSDFDRRDKALLHLALEAEQVLRDVHNVLTCGEFWTVYFEIIDQVHDVSGPVSHLPETKDFAHRLMRDTRCSVADVQSELKVALDQLTSQPWLQRDGDFYVFDKDRLWE